MTSRHRLSAAREDAQLGHACPSTVATSEMAVRPQWLPLATQITAAALAPAAAAASQPVRKAAGGRGG